MVRISSGFVILDIVFHFLRFLPRRNFDVTLQCRVMKNLVSVYSVRQHLQNIQPKGTCLLMERDAIHSTSCSMLFTSSQLKIKERIYFTQESTPRPPASRFRDLGYSSVMTGKQSCSSGARGKFGL